MFSSEVTQMSLDFGMAFMHEGPLSQLRPDTDPSWIEAVLEHWNDVSVLQDHLQMMCDDLRNNECLSGSKGTSDYQTSMIHDLRDSIRVVGTRIRELKQLQ